MRAAILGVFVLLVASCQQSNEAALNVYWRLEELGRSYVNAKTSLEKRSVIESRIRVLSDLSAGILKHEYPAHEFCFSYLRAYYWQLRDKDLENADKSLARASYINNKYSLKVFGGIDLEDSRNTFVLVECIERLDRLLVEEYKMKP